MSIVSDPVAAIDWRQRAAEITIDEGIFVGGERRAAINGTTKVVRSARDQDKSRHVLEEYTYFKTTWIRYA